jgi:biopolymer transport protein ExbD
MTPFLSKRKTRPLESADAEELNVVPYLDILMNLIIFVLLSMTGLATFVSVSVSAKSGPKTGSAPTDERLLTVGISEQVGFSLVEGSQPLGTISKRPDGQFDFAELNQRAKHYKAETAASSKIIIAADKEVPFDVLVSTMDALRETPDHDPLFRDVTLAAF